MSRGGRYSTSNNHGSDGTLPTYASTSASSARPHGSAGGPTTGAAGAAAGARSPRPYSNYSLNDDARRFAQESSVGREQAAATNSRGAAAAAAAAAAAENERFAQEHDDVEEQAPPPRNKLPPWHTSRDSEHPSSSSAATLATANGWYTLLLGTCISLGSIVDGSFSLENYEKSSSDKWALAVLCMSLILSGMMSAFHFARMMGLFHGHDSHGNTHSGSAHGTHGSSGAGGSSSGGGDLGSGGGAEMSGFGGRSGTIGFGGGGGTTSSRIDRRQHARTHGPHLPGCLRIEPTLIVLTLLLWCAGLPTIMDPSHDLAVNGTLIWNANLYYFSWLSFGAVVYLVSVAFQGSKHDVDDHHDHSDRGHGEEHKTRRRTDGLWLAVLFVSLVVLASASDVRDGKYCDGALADTDFCTNTKLALTVGSLGFVLSLVVLIMNKCCASDPHRGGAGGSARGGGRGGAGGRGSSRRRVPDNKCGITCGNHELICWKKLACCTPTVTTPLELIISIIVCALYVVAASYVTSPSGGGPGNRSGNLYFGTWGGLLLSSALMRLCFLNVFDVFVGRHERNGGGSKNRGFGAADGGPEDEEAAAAATAGDRSGINVDVFAEPHLSSCKDIELSDHAGVYATPHLSSCKDIATADNVERAPPPPAAGQSDDASSSRASLPTTYGAGSAYYPTSDDRSMGLSMNDDIEEQSYPDLKREGSLRDLNEAANVSAQNFEVEEEDPAQSWSQSLQQTSQRDREAALAAAVKEARERRGSKRQSPTNININKNGQDEEEEQSAASSQASQQREREATLAAAVKEARERRQRAKQMKQERYWDDGNNNNKNVEAEQRSAAATPATSATPPPPQAVAQASSVGASTASTSSKESYPTFHAEHARDDPYVVVNSHRAFATPVSPAQEEGEESSEVASTHTKESSRASKASYPNLYTSAARDDPYVVVESQQRSAPRHDASFTSIVVDDDLEQQSVSTTTTTEESVARAMASLTQARAALAAENDAASFASSSTSQKKKSSSKRRDSKQRKAEEAVVAKALSSSRSMSKTKKARSPPPPPPREAFETPTMSASAESSKKKVTSPPPPPPPPPKEELAAVALPPLPPLKEVSASTASSTSPAPAAVAAAAATTSANESSRRRLPPRDPSERYIRASEGVRAVPSQRRRMSPPGMVATATADRSNKKKSEETSSAAAAAPNASSSSSMDVEELIRKYHPSSSSLHSSSSSSLSSANKKANKRSSSRRDQGADKAVVDNSSSSNGGAYPSMDDKHRVHAVLRSPDRREAQDRKGVDAEEQAGGGYPSVDDKHRTYNASKKDSAPVVLDDGQEDVHDSELERGALRIQSMYRGHKSRSIRDIRDKERKATEASRQAEAEARMQYADDESIGLFSTGQESSQRLGAESKRAAPAPARNNDTEAHRKEEEELERGALRIQSLYRGHKSRSVRDVRDKEQKATMVSKQAEAEARMRYADDESIGLFSMGEESSQRLAAESKRVTADPKLQAKKEEEQELEKGALRIQSLYRGHKERSVRDVRDKELKAIEASRQAEAEARMQYADDESIGLFSMGEESSQRPMAESKRATAEPPASARSDRELKATKEEAELEKGALRIQSLYRGHKERSIRDVRDKEQKASEASKRAEAEARTRYADDDSIGLFSMGEESSQRLAAESKRASPKPPARYGGVDSQRNEQEELEKEALRIQSLYRGHKERSNRELEARKEERELEKGALRIQSLYRGHKERSVWDVRDKEMKATEASKRAEAEARMRYADDDSIGLFSMGEESSQRLVVEPKRAAAEPPARYGGVDTHRKGQDEPPARYGGVDTQSTEEEGLEKEALRIQSLYRGHKERSNRELEARKEEKEFEEGALRIQSIYRGHKGRSERDMERKATEASRRADAEARTRYADDESIGLFSLGEDAERQYESALSKRLIADKKPKPKKYGDDESVAHSIFSA